MTTTHETATATMTVSEAARALREMSASDRQWVKDLTEGHAIPYEIAVPYVRDARVAFRKALASLSPETLETLRSAG